MALVLFVIVLALLLLVLPESFSHGWSSYREKTLKSMFGLASNEYTAGHFGIVLVNFLPMLILMGLSWFFIQRRKRMLAIILSVAVLAFTANNTIQLILSLAIVVLLFTRTSRAYFQGDANRLGEATIEAEAEALDADEAEEADDSEGEPRAKTEAEGTGGGSVVTPIRATSSHSASVAAQSARPKPSADPVVDIREVGAEDAETVHTLMMEAFEEYRVAVPPSSALEETVESVREALENGGEFAIVLYEDDIPAAMARFRYDDDAIHFFRLSVTPARRKRGYARKLIQWLEQKGVSQGKSISRCKVRQSVHRNLAMYENMGYEVKDQELIVRPGGSVKSLTFEKYIGVR